VSLGKDAKDIKAAHVWLWACVCISGLGPDETETPPPHTSRKEKEGKQYENWKQPAQCIRFKSIRPVHK